MLTKDEFIKKANLIHNNKYDYSKVVFVDENTEVCIICPKHGAFWQKPKWHLLGSSCRDCGNDKKRHTVESFIKNSKEKHGDKYDYSKVEYVNNTTPVVIICPIHGEFQQKPAQHLSGHGCYLCGIDSIKKKKNYTTETFIEKANTIHKNRYDYSKVEYVNSKTDVCIICKKHGEFLQKPVKHLQGHGCIKCQYETIGNMKRKDRDVFIAEANKIHDNKYDYTLVEYVNEVTPIIITCPEHGNFIQRPANHVQGQGCPYCKISHLERIVETFLKEKSIKYKREKEFSWLKYKGKLKLDFFLPDYNLAIECQGEQHYRPIKFFGGEKKFKQYLIRDNMKKQLCDEHNINIIYVSFNDKNVDLLLEKQIITY